MHQPNFRRRLYALAICWTAITLIPSWLPFLRGAMDGPTYQWSHFGFSGSGMAGDYWFAALLWLSSVALIWTACQGPRLVFRILAPAWHLFLAGATTTFALSAEEPIVFRGDSLGIEWDITWVGPVLFAAGTVLVLIACWNRTWQNAATVQWSTANTHRLAILAALLPIQFILLRAGEPHGTTDAVGVLLLIGQLLLLPWALAPRSER